MNIRRPADIRRKKDKRHSKKQIAFVAGGVLFLAVLAGIGYVVRQSPLFLVKSITISGAPDAYGQQVVKNLIDFSRQHSGMVRILGDRNMIAWGGNEKDFLEANPDIKELRIKKEYFKRAIVVEVTGREKFGAWCHRKDSAVNDSTNASSTADAAPAGSEQDECYWFDGDGILFARAPLIRSELFNRVFDSTGRSLTLRDKIMPDRLFKNLVHIFKLLEVANINTKTVVLSDLAKEEVEADSISDPQIIFSLRFDPISSLSAIDALKKSREWGRLKVIRLYVENKVFYE